MSLIEAKLNKFSIAHTTQVKLATFTVKCPSSTWVHLLTHRQFSRNARSHRAIPPMRALKGTLADPQVPVSWRKNCKGMQPKGLIDPRKEKLANTTWIQALEAQTRFFEKLARECEVHKEIVNRLLNPWSTVTGIITCTEPGLLNFFAQRCHPDTQAETFKLAWAMADEYFSSTPMCLHGGQWHLPFADGSTSPDDVLVSAAKCARVSYLSHDKKTLTREQDEQLAHDLRASGHMSPFEHQATPLPVGSVSTSNLVGWMQYRKTIPNECRSFDYTVERAKCKALL